MMSERSDHNFTASFRRRGGLTASLSRVFPWLSVLALLLLSLWLPNRVVLSADTDVHKAKVAAAMSAAPHFINGRWVGQDVDEPIPQSARDLLRPNAVFSRSYSAPGAPPMHVLIVHCGDARDMIGHYPPICYPSSGWVQSGAADTEHVLRVMGQEFAVREYVFTRPRDHLAEDVIRVFNTFILPDGVVTSRIGDINRQSERLALTIQGVAQVQLITSAAVPLADSLAAAKELLGGLGGVLQALRAQKEENREFQTSPL